MAKYKSSILGLKVRLTVPQILIPDLQMMDNQSVGIAIREALRAAGRPGVAILKQILKAHLAGSEQSTGATERAVDIKYGRSKKNPNSFYLTIGINKSHFEVHSARIPDGQVTRLRRGRKQRGAGLYATQTRMNKKQVTKTKQVFSRYRATGRVKALNGGMFKRVPKRYFHLIDNGFVHRHGVLVQGYKFIEKLRASLLDSLQRIFEERLKNLIIPTMKRELMRKYKNVLK
jgi:hypothetical protein